MEDKHRKPTDSNFVQRIHSLIFSDDFLHLIPFKLLFFSVYAAFGITIPFLPLYFKQLGLNAAQVGVLVAIRPFMQAIGSPTGGFLADKYKKRKIIMMIATLAFAVKYLLIILVQPKNQVCMNVLKAPVNDTETMAATLDFDAEDRNAPISGSTKVWEIHGVQSPKSKSSSSLRGNYKNKLSKHQTYGTSFDGGNIAVRLANEVIQPQKEIRLGLNFHRSVKGSDTFSHTSSMDNENVISTTNTSSDAQLTSKWMVDRSELELLFIVFLVILTVGDLFASPLHPMSEAATVAYLGEDRDYYGRIRLWSSVGIATSTLVVGAIISQHTYYLCGLLRKDYLIAFYFLLGFQFIVCIALLPMKQVYPKTNENSGKQTGTLSDVFLGWKNFSFWLAVLCLGVLDGFQMDFTSWFLNDLGASSTMIGLATSVHFTVNACTFLVSNYLLKLLGYMNMLTVGFVLYVLLFFLFSIVVRVWAAAVLYALLGCAFALCWTSCVSYVAMISAPIGLLSTAQGFLSGIYTGIGIASGTAIGGVIIRYTSIRAAFRGFAGLAIIVMLIFNLIIWIDKRRLQQKGSYRPLANRDSSGGTE